MADEADNPVLGAIEAALVEMAEQAGRSGARAGCGGGLRAERFRAMQRRMGCGVPAGGGAGRDPGSDPGAALRGLMVEAGRVFAINRAAFRDMALRGFEEVVSRQNAARGGGAGPETGPGDETGRASGAGPGAGSG